MIQKKLIQNITINGEWQCQWIMILEVDTDIDTNSNTIKFSVHISMIDDSIIHDYKYKITTYYLWLSDIYKFIISYHMRLCLDWDHDWVDIVWGYHIMIYIILS